MRKSLSGPASNMALELTAKTPGVLAAAHRWRSASSQEGGHFLYRLIAPVRSVLYALSIDHTQ